MQMFAYSLFMSPESIKYLILNNLHTHTCKQLEQNKKSRHPRIFPRVVVRLERSKLPVRHGLVVLCHFSGNLRIQRKYPFYYIFFRGIRKYMG